MRRSFSSSRSRLSSPSRSPLQATPANTPQPAPAGTGQPVVDSVIADVEARREFGLRKYGTLLRTYNGRDAAMDLYQELLDAVMYLRQFVLERGAPSVPEAVSEGTWSPVTDNQGAIRGHVTFVEGSLYWRPIGGTEPVSEATPV